MRWGSTVLVALLSLSISSLCHAGDEPDCTHIPSRAPATCWRDQSGTWCRTIACELDADTGGRQNSAGTTAPAPRGYRIDPHESHAHGVVQWVQEAGDIKVGNTNGNAIGCGWYASGSATHSGGVAGYCVSPARQLACDINTMWICTPGTVKEDFWRQWKENWIKHDDLHVWTAPTEAEFSTFLADWLESIQIEIEGKLFFLDLDACVNESFVHASFEVRASCLATALRLGDKFPVLKPLVDIELKSAPSDVVRLLP